MSSEEKARSSHRIAIQKAPIYSAPRQLSDCDIRTTVRSSALHIILVVFNRLIVKDSYSINRTGDHRDQQS